MAQYPPDIASEPELPPHIQDKLSQDKVVVAVQLADTNVREML